MQEPMKRKRERSENWLREDKILLKALVRERVRAIENKDTSTNSNIAKTEAWRDLQESFNTMCKGTPRTLAQLKAQWSLIKILAKKQKCGVGPRQNLAPDTSGLTESNNEVNQIIMLDNLPEPAEPAPAPSNINISQSSEMRKKETTMIRKKNNAQRSAEHLVAFEMQCRDELHKAQMANEELLKYNLLLKQKLLQKKLDFYDRKMMEQ